MKLFSLVTFLMITSVTLVDAQDIIQPEVARYVSSSQVSLESDLEALEFISDKVVLPINSKLAQIYKIESPFATHYTYQQMTNNLPVEYAGVKLHVRKSGVYAFENYLYFNVSSAQFSEANAYLPTESGSLPVKREQVYEGDKDELIYKDKYGAIIYSSNQMKYIKRDTNVFLKVFMVNPINSSGMSYGGNLVDNGDQSTLELDSQMFWQMTNALVSNDTFYLESEFLRFKDISAPVDADFFTFSDSMTYSRDEQEFEYINAYYHLDKMGKYVNGLGYDALTRKLDVDVHALNGWDNSAYSPTDHSLQFGEGGIDDAEDGEVIIHEFTHSLSELASPNNTIGIQREAMEEGSCDYLAKAYSRSINDNTPNKVFSWDGNLTWDGFSINTNRLYPRDLRNSKDGDRDMWSSALMCIHDKIGRQATDSILLEHFFYQGANTTMASMAQVFIDIDDEDFNGRYYKHIKDCFVDAGFLPQGASIYKIKNTPPYKIINQQGFVTGESDLRIELTSEVAVDIYDMQGNLLSSFTPSTSHSLKPSDYPKGLYVLRFSNNGQNFSQKILR
jgi:hypothetical protein